MAKKKESFDVFICHAGEDKEAIVRPLVEGLAPVLKVWYDEFSLKLGDSLRQSIEKGLANSRYGVVVLSPAFFAKDWPQAELNGLFTKEISGNKTILPVWHDIDQAYLRERSPMLADRKAVRTTEGIDHVIEQILDTIKPNRSHMTRSGQTVSVKPTFIRLHAGGWRVKTPVLVSNLSNSPLYSVGVKIAIQTKGVKSDSIQIEPDSRGTDLRGVINSIEALPDGLVVDFIDSDGREAVAIVLHTIEPKRSRELIVSSTTSVDCHAQVQVWSFKTEPAEVLERDGEISVPFSPPESVQVKAFRIMMRKRA